MCSGISILALVIAMVLPGGCGSKGGITGQIKIPTLDLPANGAVNQPFSLTVSWGTVASASSYKIRVSPVATFATTISSQTGLTEESVPVSGLAAGTTYFWEVRAIEAADTSGWSDVWSFTTLALPAMINIPAGTFQMGDSDTTILNGAAAIPVHSVTLGAFTMSQTLITQAFYKAVSGVNPAYFDSGATWPVEYVNWYDAALFCNKLSNLMGLDTVYSYTGINQGTQYDTLGSVSIDYTKNGYRLPTEAEFEYACRAGTSTDYYWGRNYPPTSSADTLAIDSNAVWYYSLSNSTRPVATKKPNALGLYDMSGNLLEWCNDWFGGYAAGSQTNPTGAAKGSYRVLRGGAWNYGDAGALAVSFRESDLPDIKNFYYGFRIVTGPR